MRILVAEDDKDMNRIIVKRLTAEGHAVDGCFDGREALYCLESGPYDAAVLDIMMPEMDGIQVVRKLRLNGNLIPVIFLTARDSVSDKVRGLDSGANDYLVKPFSFDELSARLRAVTRTAAQVTGNEYKIADLSLNTETHIVTRAGREISLTKKEYMLLEFLMRNKGTVLTRQKIEDHVWNYDYEGGTNVVDVYIKYLRNKIDAGHDVKLIHTVRGIGYTMREK